MLGTTAIYDYKGKYNSNVLQIRKKLDYYDKMKLPERADKALFRIFEAFKCFARCRSIQALKYLYEHLLIEMKEGHIFRIETERE